MLSCNSDTNNNNSFEYLNRNIEFTISSTNGVDLLNPNNTNAYLEGNIKIFNLINENIVEAYNQNADNPRDFRIVSPENSGDERYYIRVFINNPKTENAITYIKWNETETDTIKSNSTVDGKILTQAWYNNELIFDENTNNLPEIIKN